MDDGTQSVRAGPKLSVAFDWRHFFSEQDIKLQCDRYNSYCSILHQTGKLQLVDDTRWNAAQQDVLELEQTLKDAKDTIDLKLQGLDKSVQLFASEIAANADPRWYRGVEDLTAYDDPVFMHIMEKMSIVDAPDFAEYLMEALPRAVKTLKPEHECYRDSPFLGKAIVLLRKLLQSCGDDYSVVLTVAITMKTRILPWESPRNPTKVYIDDWEYVELERMMETLLRHHEFQIKKDPDLFWNLAAGFRQTSRHARKHRRYRSASMSLIDTLRDKAEVEIRRRTVLAINGRLPAELADLLAEFAMLAEEVPLR